MLEKLLEIARRMKNQDTQCTAHPVYVVQERRRVYGIDPQWTDDIVWLYDGEEIDDSDEDLIKAKRYYEEHLEEPEPEWTRTGYIDRWEFVQLFFSREAADDYIRSNKHRLKDPHVYVDSAYRNYELQDIIEILNRLGAYTKENNEFDLWLEDFETKLANH